MIREIKMQKNYYNPKQNHDNHTISVNNIISNLSHISQNKVMYQKISTIKTYKPKKEINSYKSTSSQNGQNQSTAYKSFVENLRYKQSKLINEKPEMLSKIIVREDKNEKPKVEINNHYNKFVKTTTKPNNIEQSFNFSYYNSAPNLRHSISYHTRRRISPNNNHNERTPSNHKIYYSNASRSNSKYKYSNINRSQSNIFYTQPQNQQNNSTLQYTQKNNILPNKLFHSNYYNKINPKPIATRPRPVSNSLNYERKSLSPEIYDLKRKTINRGNPIKNVQITHIICCNQPRNFNIRENLSTEFLETEPLRLSQTERINLKKSGKTTWTTSVQDNIKPIISNLKGRTTIYQHARGIGMTNDDKSKLNPQFYTSTIRKLNPIRKRKQKEKVEYMTFRNETGRSNVHRNNFVKNKFNNKINNGIIKSVNYVKNFNIKKSIYNNNIGNKNNNNNKREVVKDIRIIIQIDDNQNNIEVKPIIYNKNDRKIIHSICYFKK